MRKSHEVAETTLSGHEYDIDEDSTLYVFPGFAFMKDSIGASDTPYVFSMSPAKLDSLMDGVEGVEIEQTVYRTSSRMYITTDYDAPFGVVDILVDGVAYKYDETFTVQSCESIDEYGNSKGDYGEEYIRLVNGWSHVDDLCLSKSEFERRINEGDFLRLWPVWECAHR